MGIGHGLACTRGGVRTVRHPARHATRMAQGGAQREVDAVSTGADVAGAAPRPRRRSHLGLDEFAWPLASAPSWRCVTSAYIVAFTDDDKRSATLVLVGTWLFGAQVFPAASVTSAGGVDALAATRPGLVTVWTHSLLGLVWLLNWSTLGASMGRRVIDDEVPTIVPAAAERGVDRALRAGRGGVSTVRVDLGVLRNRGGRTA